MASRQWSASEMPRQRRDLLSALDQVAVTGSALEVFDPQIAAEAPLFWVTADMTATAWDASTDLPDWLPVDTAPSPTGLLLWATPLPPLPGYLHGITPNPPISGIYWRIHSALLNLAILTRSQDLLPQHRSRDGQQLLPVEMIGNRPANQPISLGANFRGSGLVAVIGATWLMMQEPGVGATRIITGAGGSGRSWSREERAVTLIDLRPLAERATSNTDASGRVYTHRWIVRGHWRQQPYGPGRTLRRPTWLASYIKGPAGAPLLIKDTVRVWCR